jgi:hypothetical protein
VEVGDGDVTTEGSGRATLFAAVLPRCDGTSGVAHKVSFMRPVEIWPLKTTTSVVIYTGFYVNQVQILAEAGIGSARSVDILRMIRVSPGAKKLSPRPVRPSSV